MICQNKEKFDYSKILFEQITVHDSEGKDIFKLNNYTNTESFACEISVNSIPKKVVDNNSTIIDDTDQKYKHQNSKTSSSGLSGGAIAGIVIAIIAVLVIILVIFALVKNGIFSRKKIPPHSINSITENNGSNTLNKLYYNNAKNN